jgi:hypothetical protein
MAEGSAVPRRYAEPDFERISSSASRLVVSICSTSSPACQACVVGEVSTAWLHRVPIATPGTWDDNVSAAMG